MTTYKLTKETARQMLDTWFATGFSLSDSDAIHRMLSMFTVYDLSSLNSVHSLKELHSSDEVRCHLTPGQKNGTDQENLVPYGAVLNTIVQYAAKATPFVSDAPARFVIVYE